MNVTVKLKHLRIAPRKTRLVADMVRKKKAEEALTLLDFKVRKASDPIKKLLKSAIASAENDLGLKKENLFISKINVNEGPTLKRSRPRARGRFFPIMKRTSHIVLTLDELEPTKKQKKKAVEKKEKLQLPETKKETRIKTERKTRPERTRVSGVKIKNPLLKRVFRRKSF